MASVDELRAELAVRELEEQLVADKAALQAEADERAAAIVARLQASTDPDEIRQLAADLAAAQVPDRRDPAAAEQLREARRAHRELRAARDAGPGDARPATIEATSEVQL